MAADELVQESKASKHTLSAPIKNNEPAERAQEDRRTRLARNSL